ncbi:helix-turn-helix domain-containing protein [Paenibacillus sp. GXUN7292]|uniref:helix-turn-helix domain-containing protein n=1 Tax=Paenibacillus sp. GXUN7292 TaxID=3422499 RepID=UPI003D7DC666
MKNCVQKLPKLSSLMFQLSFAEKLYFPAEWVSERQCEKQRHTLLITTKRTFGLYVNDQLIPAGEKSCYLLSPGNSWYASNLSSYDVELYCIYFSIIHIDERGQEIFEEQMLPIHHAWHMYSYERCIRLVNGILTGDEDDKAGELAWFKRHLLFQELMGVLLEHNWSSERDTGDMQAVSETIRYLEAHYVNSITVRQLAERAQLPAWQYSAMFKNLTGKKPLDYLNQLRIDRSKELLLSVNVPLREIACKVGFADEYYFNRRFRQFTGMTPRQYAQSAHQTRYVYDWTGHQVQIPVQPQRILYYGETIGDLLILGIRPIGASVRVMKNTWMHAAFQEVEDIGIPLNTQKAASLEPDLIIFSSSDERQYAQLTKIAPTITYDTFAPLEQRLLCLGEWLGKQTEAEQWLAEYRRRLSEMWQTVKKIIEPGETATVFIYHRGRRLFVMGTSGLAGLLYHPSGFEAGAAVRQMLDAGEPYREIEESDVPLYAGDRLFVLMPTIGPSCQATRELMLSNSWKKLSAVKNARVHVLEEAKWNLTDAYTREHQIRLLPELLKGRQEQ